MDNQLLKGGVIMAIFWWLWFRETPVKTRDREFVLAGIIGSSVALIVARTLAMLLPFRERPLRAAGLNFVLPFGVDQHVLPGWSSFPSDHAVLFFALATFIYFLSHKVGLYAYCYVLFIICLPRIYLGFHYPTDIIGGALLGVSVALIFNMKSLRRVLTARPLTWSERSPATFYPFFFLATFLLGTNFEPLRFGFAAVYHALRHST